MTGPERENLSLLFEFVKVWREEDTAWKVDATKDLGAVKTDVALLKARNKAQDEDVRKDGISRRVKVGLTVGVGLGALSFMGQALGFLGTVLTVFHP